MSRRDSILKATAGGLNPNGIDLTKLAPARSVSRDRRSVHVRPDVAAGALAYAVNRGADKLAMLLLRFKYVDQMSKESFTQAHLLLLRRHGWMARRPSETMFAVAYAAIFEWVHDACPKCRNRRPGGARAEDGKGMVCVPCQNSGRAAFTAKQRWAIVNDYLLTAQESRGQQPTGIALKAFGSHWVSRYHRFIDALRRVDKTITEGVDFGFHPLDNREIESPRQEQNYTEGIEPIEEPMDEPAAAQGKVVPKNSEGA